MKYLKIVLFFVFISFVIISCDETSDPSKSLVFPASNVSYGSHVQVLFNYKCALPGCHDEAPSATRLSLTSYYGTVVQYNGIVIPGMPDNSILIQRLKGSLIPRMPLLKDTLSQNHYIGLRTWIKEGAKNN
jgi:hypothetical protein